MKGRFLLALAAAAVIAPGAQAEEVGKYIYEYQADTYRVQTLRYGPEDANQMLVRISGIDNDQDGRIYLHTRKCDTTRCDAYKWVTTEVHKPGGTQWFTIHNPGGWDAGDILQPYLVEPSASGKLRLGKREQTNLDPDFFLASYKRQQGGN